MPEFYSKSVVFRAEQVPGADDLIAWGRFAVFMGANGDWVVGDDKKSIVLHPKSDIQTVVPEGYWIIKEQQRFRYTYRVFSPDVFADSFAPVT